MNPTLEFNPPLIAHRGMSGIAPENTMIAFIKAVQANIKWVEFDVMAAACGEPVIFHDETLERTTNGRGLIEHYSYDYLRTLDAGSWFSTQYANETIPSLKQMIDLLNNTQLSANVELKPSPGKEALFINRVLKEFAPFLAKNTNRILFSSFSIDTLIELRKQSPHALIGLLLHDWIPDWQKIGDSLDCISIHVNQAIISPETAKQIKAMNKYLLCYTVNQAARAKELFNFGVDAVFTDHPQ